MITQIILSKISFYLKKVRKKTPFICLHKYDHRRENNDRKLIKRFKIESKNYNKHK